MSEGIVTIHANEGGYVMDSVEVDGRGIEEILAGLFGLARTGRGSYAANNDKTVLPRCRITIEVIGDTAEKEVTSVV